MDQDQTFKELPFFSYGWYRATETDPETDNIFLKIISLLISDIFKHKYSKNKQIIQFDPCIVQLD